MDEAIAIFSGGLWRLRSEVERLTGRAARRPPLWPGAGLAVAGWGHKPTARLARHYARSFGLAYAAIEDGFLRSLRPGPGQRPLAMVADWRGIYYDAAQASDLEHILQSTDYSAAELGQADELLALIAAERLSKYNDAADPLPAELRQGAPPVLLIDQTLGDAAIAGGLASASSFRAMAEAAHAENPGARILVKLHPETLTGRKAGYLDGLAGELGLGVLAGRINPHELFALAPKVYTVSSQFGFEALLAGLEVHCFGIPFYAGWGLTRDRQAVARRSRRLSRRELAAGAYLRYSRYFDAWTRREVAAVEAAQQLAFLRRHYLGNARTVIGYGIARWKRKAVSAMLAGAGGAPRFINRRGKALAAARAEGAVLAAWGRTAQALRRTAAAQGLAILAIEDGFLRSRGLGAAFTAPRSLTFDGSGLHYDPATASDLETMLATATFDAAELARAGRLLEAVLAADLSKYNVAGETAPPAVPAGRRPVVVIGQVEDDWAVERSAEGCGLGRENVNAWLLRRARERSPGAFIIFKPHPDVEVLGRAGRLSMADETTLADHIARHHAVTALLRQAAEVETFSSLAGLEALMRGRSVTVHGGPFYAGWGLTTDRCALPRRGRPLTLEALLAAAYLRYARYWDPESGLACPAETAVARLAAAAGERPGLRSAILQLAGRSVISWRRLAAALRRAIDRQEGMHHGS